MSSETSSLDSPVQTLERTSPEGGSSIFGALEPTAESSISSSTGLPRRPLRSWPRFWKEELVLPLGRFFLFYLVLLAGLVFFENRLVFPGGATDPKIYELALGAVREATGKPVEEVSFSAPGGPKLNGWFVDGGPRAPAVLMFHANGGEIAGWSRMQMEIALASQASVLAMDCRGYGESEGSPSEAGLLADGRAGRKWLAERCGVREDEIILVGRSLGGAIAIDLAQDGAAGLLTECTFTSVPDVAARKFFLFPVRMLMSTQLNSLEKIRRVRCPTWLVHGDSDTLVPFEHSDALFAACGAKHKQRTTLVGMGHFTPWSESQWQARAAFFRWLNDPSRSADVTAPTVPYIKLRGQTVTW